MKLLKLEKYNCAPCKMVESLLEDSGADYEKVNIEDNPDVAMQYGVMGVPVVILLDEDEEVERVVGFDPPKIMNLINKVES